jgi:hypothetical protein
MIAAHQNLPSQPTDGQMRKQNQNSREQSGRAREKALNKVAAGT